MEKNYKEILPLINTFIFDVDGVLTDGNVIVFPGGDQIRTMNIKDGYAIKTAISKGYHICVISGGSNQAIVSRLKDLGITDIYLGAHNKVEQLKEFFDIYRLSPETALYMGDDIPDLLVMQMVALPACPQDAVPEIKKISKYVSKKKGGKGCVRDVIEQVLKVQDQWHSDFDAQYF